MIGGVDMQQQARELAKRPHVVVATPGRLAVSRAGLAGVVQDWVMSGRAAC